MKITIVYHGFPFNAQRTAMSYALAHVVHLLCAVAFIGVVFFEVLILEGVRDKLGPLLMTQVETGIIARAKRIMPWVVATLFLTGLAMAYFHRSELADPFATSFGLFLTIKILLALSVLVHFITAMRSATGGCMDSSRFQRTHLSVFIHMFLIVVLAKAMFYVSW